MAATCKGLCELFPRGIPTKKSNSKRHINRNRVNYEIEYYCGAACSKPIAQSVFDKDDGAPRCPCCHQLLRTQAKDKKRR